MTEIEDYDLSPLFKDYFELCDLSSLHQLKTLELNIDTASVWKDNFKQMKFMKIPWSLKTLIIRGYGVAFSNDREVHISDIFNTCLQENQIETLIVAIERFDLYNKQDIIHGFSKFLNIIRENLKDVKNIFIKLEKYKMDNERYFERYLESWNKNYHNKSMNVTFIMRKDSLHDDEIDTFYKCFGNCNLQFVDTKATAFNKNIVMSFCDSNTEIYEKIQFFTVKYDQETHCVVYNILSVF